MFDNIGDKIKGLAKVICWIGIITSIICAIVLIYEGTQEYSGTAVYVIGGIAVGVISCMLSWAGSFVLYGYGELITTQQVINSKLSTYSSAAVKNSRY